MAEAAERTMTQGVPIDQGMCEVGSSDGGAVVKGPVDVRAIMAEIRRSIRARAEESRDQWPTFRPEQGVFDIKGHRKAGDLQHSEELRMVNLLAVQGLAPESTPIISHRRGLVGRVVVAVKRRMQRLVWSLFQTSIDSERDFRQHVARVLNEMVFYVDDRDGALFWEAMRKGDNDVTRVLRRIEELIDEQRAMIEGTERRLDERLQDGILHEIAVLKASVARSDALAREVAMIDGVVRGLEGILPRLGRTKGGVEAQQPASVAEGTVPDLSYLLLENRYRGSAESIAARVAPYVEEYLREGAPRAPVLDIGAGRGELVGALSRRGVAAYGVDLDRGMVEEANSAGIDVRLGDGIAHLAALEDGSLGGVVATQVVEHLTRDQLRQLCSVTAQKVVAGGTVIFETINPCSLVALSSNYFRDLTHVWPLHPDTLAYEMELAGMRVREVRYLSPVPAEAQLAEVSISAAMSPVLRQAFEQVNGSIRQLNRLVYGFQDYCIIAEPAVIPSV